MELRSNAESRIPVAAARLYPHVADDASSTDIAIAPGPMDVSCLVVDLNVESVGYVSVMASTDRDEVDPYGVELDLTPAAARQLARQLEAAVDALPAGT